MVRNPLIFIHTGKQRYLKEVIRLAEEHGNEVYLIGDESNQSYCRNWIDANQLEISGYERFKTLYKHMSTNRTEFELGCFKRYYLLQAFINKMHFDTCFMMDSDVCVYADLTHMNLGRYDVACGVVDDEIPNIWCASPHSSFWTKDALNRFLEFMEATYEKHDSGLYDIWEYHQKNGIFGGVSDMVLLRLYINDEQRQWKNLAIADKGEVFDDNVNCSCNYIGQEYRMRKLLFHRQIKKVIFDKGRAYLLNMQNERVLTPVIHAQGEAKMYISCLAKYRNNILFYYLTDIYHEVTTWVWHQLIRSRGK